VAQDVALALAFVARRQGRPAMPLSEWCHVLSLDLGWMSPAQAKAFVARATAAGLLVEASGGLRLSFDPLSVDMPRGFRPDPSADASSAVVDLFPAWLDRLAKTMGGREAVLSEVARRQERLGGYLDAVAAVLWIAAEQGHDVREPALAHARALVRPATA
jgi:hypothetical protein